MKTRSIAVIGLGHVGAHVAYSLAVQGIADELLLIDANEQKAVSECQDLRDSVAYLPHRVNVNVGGFSDLKDWSLNIINGIGSKSDVCAPFSYSPLMQKAILYIHENYASKITIDSLANRLYTSRRSLTRCFKSETGKTFNEYLTDYRMEIAKNMLRSDTYKIFEIGNLVGYTDQKHFHKTFKRVTGHNPTYYKNASSDGGEKTE